MGGIERPVKSLETKWGSIKCNVSKFIACMDLWQCSM